MKRKLKWYDLPARIIALIATLWAFGYNTYLNDPLTGFIAAFVIGLISHIVLGNLGIRTGLNQAPKRRP